MNTKSRAVITTTVGYMCLALMGWMISMTNAAWFSRVYNYGEGIILPLGLILGLVGILAYLQNRSLDAVVFLGGTALFLSDYGAVTHTTVAAAPGTYVGWFAFIWAVFFCYVWLGSFKSGAARILFLLGMWLTLLSLAIAGWTGLVGFTILGGYLGLVTSVIAAVTSAIVVIKFGMKQNPNLEVPKATPIAAD